MSAIIFGSLIMHHLHSREGHRVSARIFMGFAIVACVFQTIAALS